MKNASTASSTHATPRNVTVCRAPSSVITGAPSWAALADEFAADGVEVTVVMPPFTNTELIAGTKSTGTSKPVQPEDVAAAPAEVDRADG